MNRRIESTVRRHLDEQIDSVRPLAHAARPPKGWVNAIRQALGMTEAQLGERMGTRQSSVHGLERSEADGTIRLETLRRAAEALDCELAYVLVPRRPLEETVVGRARQLARDELARVGHTMSLEAQEVGFSDAALEQRTQEILARGGLWRRSY